MTALSVLTSLTVILLIGLLVSAFASKLRVPGVLLLIIVGILLGSVQYKEAYLISFPEIFLTSISILALALIIFDSTSKLKIREFDTFSLMSIKLSLVFLVINLLVLPFAIKLLFGLPLFLGFLFAAVMMGTSPEITLSLLSGAKQKTIEVLKIESIFNTPLTVLFPFIILDLTQEVEFVIVATFIEQIGPFLAKFASGLGSGLLVSIILFKVLQKRISQTYTPLAVIVSALLSYVLAENIGGSGILAVTTLGLFVGNVSAKSKKKVTDVLTLESQLAKALYILVFVLIGFIIKIPLDNQFFISAGILFIIYLFIRYISVYLTVRGAGGAFSFKERLFMTINMPKGIAVAVVAFTFAAYAVEGSSSFIPGMHLILDLTLIFMLATIILSSIATYFAKAFVGEAPKPEK